jgi:uncharacterized OB-fold protein
MNTQTGSEGTREGAAIVREGLFDWPSAKPALIGHRCRQCGQFFFPQRSICPDCFEDGTLEQVRLSRRGRLYTFCIVERGPIGFEAPYGVGYVDLPEGLRIYSLLTEKRFECLKIGMEMELVVGPIRKDSQGNEVIGYQFRPLSPGVDKTRE